MAAVAAIAHPLGEDVWFVHDDQRVWSWWVMVAPMDEDSIRFVVEDGDNSRGLVGCEIRRRGDSYDHKRQVQFPDDNPRLRGWGFTLERSDGTVVRLHPQWSHRDIPTCQVEGVAEITIPRNGLGKSDGRGTFKCYKEIGRQRTLKFAYRYEA